MESINDYLSNPLDLGRQSADALELLREKYPYFQVLHILIAKCHKNQNTFGYNKNLKLASLFAGNRKILFDYINYEGKSLEQAEQAESEAMVETLNEVDVTEMSEANPTVLADVQPINQETVLSIETVEPKKQPIFEVVEKRETETPIEQVAEVLLVDEEPEVIKISEEIETRHEEDSLVAATIEILPINEPQSVQQEELESELATIEQTDLAIEDSDATENFETQMVQADDELPLEIDSFFDESIEPPDDANDLETLDSEFQPENSSNTIALNADEKVDEGLDFNSWLDNFTLDPPALISKPIEPAPIEISEAQVDERFITDFAETTEPINIDEELDELVAKDHPAILAELAYDIQAFVNIPESHVESEPEKPIQTQLQIEDLLDRFINKNPKISKPKAEFYNADNMARKSEELNDDVVSETLALLFYRQGHLHQSLGIYEKLILQNPDKNKTFAAQINKIKQELINRL